MPITDATDPLVDALVQSAFGIVAVLTRVGAQHELSLTQLRVLGILRDRRLRMTDLAEYLGLEKSTLSGLINRAETRGLIERAPSADDRRAIEVFLSPTGQRLGAELYATVAAELRSRTTTLDPSERVALRRLLDRTLDSGPDSDR